MSENFIVPELIRKKREGLEHSPEEIAFLTEGFAKGSIPDYQISAWLMAAFFKGLNIDEIFALTSRIKNSGRALHWRDLSTNFKDAKFADKHSTGGVGDKVSLILAPVAACLGLKVPMMSGRGLGHTGGTVDKLQSIEGFDLNPTTKKMVECLDTVGICMMGQSEDLCPADRKLYALRDVTATIESIPLITASIVSKKWAAGVDAIVYDVKSGSGAFMSDFDSAHKLAKSLVEVSKRAGIKALSVITRMEEPLGAFVGNAVEVNESIAILTGDFKSDNHRRLAKSLVMLSCGLAAEMAVLAGTRSNLEEAIIEAAATLENGEAYKVFCQMIHAQGGKDNWRERLPEAERKVTLSAREAGFVKNIDSRKIGIAGLTLGIGRVKATDSIDPTAGFEFHVMPGDEVQKGNALVTVHSRSSFAIEKIENEVYSAFHWGKEARQSGQLVIGKISA